MDWNTELGILGAKAECLPRLKNSSMGLVDNLVIQLVSSFLFCLQYSIFVLLFRL
jgi:hypothetical protein